MSDEYERLKQQKNAILRKHSAALLSDSQEAFERWHEQRESNLLLSDANEIAEKAWKAGIEWVLSHEPLPVKERLKDSGLSGRVDVVSFVDKLLVKASAPDDPARAIANLLSKLDDEDKATFNWIVASAVTTPSNISETGSVVGDNGLRIIKARRDAIVEAQSYTEGDTGATIITGGYEDIVCELDELVEAIEKALATQEAK